MRKLLDDVVVRIQSLDLEVAATHAVFSVEKPRECVVERCLASSVLSAKLRDVCVEVRCEVSDSFEVQKTD